MYEANNRALLNGHTNYPIGGEGGLDKTTGEIRNRNMLDDRADISDSIANIIGGGYTSFSDEDVKANFGRLADLIGKDKAQALITQAFIFNSTNADKSKTPGERIASFYSSGSQNPDVDKILSTMKTFGGGAQSRLNQSRNTGSIDLSGRQDVSKAGTISARQLNDLNSNIPK